eukprot:gb/GECG01016684.1/.p1 GENE.gb/GECG01016684.1/~~gb/GECG01016684.1/.p1  ORF type:complete len:353 (+),score=70.44 gb/GECG01016684.1/:1-1059(+)
MKSTTAQNMQQKQLSGSAMASLLGQDNNRVHGPTKSKGRPTTTGSRPHGYRYERKQYGEPVTDHFKENVKLIRQKQRENQQKKALQEASANYTRPEFKMPKFRDVPSKVSEYLKSDRSPGSANSSREYLKKGTGNRMSTPRKQSTERNEDEENLADSARKLSFSRHDANPSGVDENESVSTEGSDENDAEQRRRRPLQKPPVPRADEINELPSREDKDFIRNNAVYARKYPSKSKQNKEENPLERQGYGEVPKYLQKRKQAWERENARRALYEEDPECPPGMIPMSDKERVETLETLQTRREEAKALLSRLPLVVETASAIQRKEDLEAKVKELDDAIKIFSRPKVYVEPDE